MNKKIMALITAIIMISLTACAAAPAQAPAPATAEDTAAADASSEAVDESDIGDTADAADDEDYIDEEDSEPKAEEITPDADGNLSNGFITITMPKDTQGLYIALATDHSIGIYDKEQRDDGFGGYVFSVQTYAEPDQYAGGLDIKYGEMTDQDGQVYDVTVMEATDVQWDYEKYSEMPDSYGKLYGAKEEVVNSLKPVQGGEYVPGKGTKGEDLYGDVIEQFRTAISEGWDANKLEENDMSSMYYAVTQGDGNPDAMKITGYAYKDLNSDGIDELVVGEIAEGDYKGTIYDIYTMIDRKPAHVVSGYGRSRYYAVPSLIVNEYSDSAAVSGITSFYLTPNSTEMIPQIALKEDYSEDENAPWYRATDVDKDEWEKVTEDEYNEYLGRINEFIRFDFTPFGK